MNYQPVWRRYRKEWILLLLVFLTFLLGTMPAVVERWYSTGIYPFIAKCSRFCLGWIPFSVGDVLYGIAAVVIFIRLFRFVKKWRRKELSKTGWGMTGRKLARVLMIIYLAFQWLWGLNYHRQGTAHQLSLEPGEYTLAELTQLADTLNSRLTGLVNQMQPADTAAWQNYDSLRLACIRSYEQATARFPFASYKIPSVKKMLVGDIGGYGGFTGYLNPFTGEAQADADLPPFLLPFIMCHEMAHQLGYAAEEEANMVGYLAARVSSSSAVRYSVYHDLMSYAGREMYAKDSNAYRVLREKLPPLVKAHNKQAVAYFASFRNPVQILLNRWYDMYLKANSQEKGLQSYSYVTAWLIAYAKKYGWNAL